MPPLRAGELEELAAREAGVVIADRIAERSRDVLVEQGWGWLDRRRGSLRIWTPGLRIDASITPSIPPAATTRNVNAFTPAGIEVALWLLTHPDEAISPRRTGRELGISPSQVSVLAATLRDEALLRKDGRALVPELFWALAEHWHPRRHALAALPDAAERASSPELRSDRWVVGDTRAALALGAPVVAGADHPPDLYLPDSRSLSWLMGRAVKATDWESRAATVAVAPTPLVCDPRITVPSEPFPLAHPVVVALDLAADRGRGREILEDWSAEAAGVTRVW